MLWEQNANVEMTARKRAQERPLRVDFAFVVKCCGARSLQWHVSRFRMIILMVSLAFDLDK